MDAKPTLTRSSAMPLQYSPLTRRSFMAALVASSVLAACGSEASQPAATTTSTPTGPALPNIDDATPVGHSYSRQDVSPGANITDVVAADRKLATDLFDLIGQHETGNFIFSPYSIATAFSMAEAGAEGETESQMRTTLRIGLDEADWHAGRNTLDHIIRTPIHMSDGAEPLELEIANTPFGQAGFEFVDMFIKLLAEEYGADLVTLDFKSNPEAARQLINEWVADATRDRITDLLPEGSIDELVRLVLVNTVFFKAQWVDEFDPAQTTSAPFTLLDSTEVQVDMMHGSTRTTYGQGEGWQMVRLPYWGGYSMTLLVPEAEQFDAVADLLSEGLLDEVSAIASDYLVSLSLPKFDFATPTDLIPLFNTLGMKDPFDLAAADFSGMTTEASLYISGAFHQATIELDEIGTTATAATALIISPESAPQPVELQIDRPFIFVIEHDETTEPLFIGRVHNPNS